VSGPYVFPALRRSETWMDKDIYYIVTKGGAPAVEEVPAVNGRPPSSASGPSLPERARRWSP